MTGNYLELITHFKKGFILLIQENLHELGEKVVYVYVSVLDCLTKLGILLHPWTIVNFVTTGMWKWQDFKEQRPVKRSHSPLSSLSMSGKSKRSHSLSLPCPCFPCQKQATPAQPLTKAIPWPHVAIFHLSSPEPRTEVGMGMDMESTPPAYSPAAASRIGIPCLRGGNAMLHPFQPAQAFPWSSLTYLAQWSRSFSVLFCGTRKSKQAYFPKQRGIFTADLRSSSLLLVFSCSRI